MKILILTSVVSDQFSYAPGDKPDVSHAEAERLIRGGFALRLVDMSGLLDEIATAAEDADYTLMPYASGVVPAPSGGYYFDDDHRLHLIHPSGGVALLDPLYFVPAWSR